MLHMRRGQEIAPPRQGVSNLRAMSQRYFVAGTVLEGRKGGWKARQ
jgi:hypothetical protein